jgi:sugar/nucleoside kinase (ribokinase family)
MRVLGFGDNVVDRFLDRNIDYPGGNCVNVAVFAAGRGADSAYLGAFGSDDIGEFIRSELDSMGIETARCVVRDGESGIAQVEVVDGERIFRGGNHGGVPVREPVELGDEELAYAATFDLIHSSVYSSAEPELPKLDRLDALVSYDLSSEDAYRTDEYLRSVAPHVDLALLSCSDLDRKQTEDALRLVIQHGAAMALGTRGADGSVLFDGRRFHHAQAVPLDPARTVADTMGCGDAFLAAFAVSAFGSGWRKGVLPDAAAIEAGLAGASAYAAEQCFVDGAFGHGRTVGSSSRRTARR